MGLLDDAIREHLELKRLRGADPGDVAREEHDALGPVRREGDVEHSGAEDAETKRSMDTDGSFFPDPEPSSPSSNAGQETIEINMEEELAADAEVGGTRQGKRPERAAPVAHPAHTQAATEESLEWEMPGDRPDRAANATGEMSEVDPLVAEDPEAAEHVEDVLEETPDFLRDTPEQERLWFEQRPPRDFDFNE
jgi:hypothetical protein